MVNLTNINISNNTNLTSISSTVTSVSFASGDLALNLTSSLSSDLDNTTSGWVVARLLTFQAPPYPLLLGEFNVTRGQEANLCHDGVTSHFPDVSWT